MRVEIDKSLTRTVRARWSPEKPLGERIRRRFPKKLWFWKPWLAGKAGMFCLRVGASDLAKKLIDYEMKKTLVIASDIAFERTMDQAAEHGAKRIGEDLDREILEQLEREHGDWN